MPTLATITRECQDVSKGKRIDQPLRLCLWRCEDCGVVVASEHPPAGGCQQCGYAVLLQVSKAEPAFDRGAYVRDVRANRENYVRYADCVREVIAKRRAEGKPVWDFKDLRAGDAA
jgi:predicted  nucleic acid-binding Zn-ribbon protein